MGLLVLVGILWLCLQLYKRHCRKKTEKFEEVEYMGEHHDTQEGEEAGEDLHTARGGIIEM